MPDTLQYLCGVPVLMCSADGPIMRTARDAMDIIGEAGCRGARWVVVPADRVDDAFFELRTKVAGEIFQKFAIYRVGLAIVGDISRHTIASSTVLVGADAPNIASLRVIEKLGMTAVGEIAPKQPGTWFFALNRNEFLASQKG